jgi:hypothetical protein
VVAGTRIFAARGVARESLLRVKSGWILSGQSSLCAIQTVAGVSLLLATILNRTSLCECLLQRGSHNVLRPGKTEPQLLLA